MNVLTASGTPDGTTALLTATGVLVAYGNREPDIDFFMRAAGGGTFIAKGGIPDNIFRPNWFVWAQGNTLFAHVAGTDLIPSRGAHLWSDVSGYFFTSEQTRNRLWWQTFFHAAGRDVALAVIGEIVTTRGLQWTKQVFSGHSYGAAVAQIACWLVNQNGVRNNVGYCGWGCPKPAFCTASEAGIPDSCVFNASRDPVGYQPSPEPPVASLPNIDPWAVIWGGESLSWRHLCPVWQCDDASLPLWGGSGIQNQSMPISITLTAHSMVNYRNTIRDYRRRQLGQ